MELFMIVLAIATVVALVVLDVFAVHRDGYGSTLPPNSHENGHATSARGNRFF